MLQITSIKKETPTPEVINELVTSMEKNKIKFKKKPETDILTFKVNHMVDNILNQMIERAGMN